MKKYIWILPLLLTACNKNEDAVNTPPTLSDQVFATREDIASGESIGTLTASDPDGGASLTFTIVEDASQLFSINSSTGTLSLSNGKSLDFEAAEVHTLRAEVSDGQSSATGTITINVLDVNEEPEATDQQFTVKEDIDDTQVIGTVTATDMDKNSTIVYKIVSNDGELFEIDQQSGEISLSTGSNLDFETKETHTLVVEASDGILSVSPSVTISVENVNEAPTIIEQVFTVSEESADIGVIEAIDPEGNTLSYTILSNDNDLFEINGSEGFLALANDKILDFESQTVHELTVQVSDGEFNRSAAISVEVTDVNEAPILANQLFSIPEDIDAVAVIGTLPAVDQDVGAVLSFSITSNPESLFEVNFSTGELSLIDGFFLDFEKTPSHEIIVEVSDGTFTTSAVVTIDVTNVIDVNVTTFASGVTFVQGLVFDAQGNMYATSGSTIRKIDPSGNVTLFAGNPSVQGTADGPASSALFSIPDKIVIDASGNLYIADTGNHTIRMIDTNGNVSTIAGIADTPGYQDGLATSGLLSFPVGLAVDNGALYITEIGNHSIRKLDFTTNNLTTIAGTTTFSGFVDGAGSVARFNRPYDITQGGSGTLAVSDFSNHSIRSIDATDQVSTMAGDGTSGSSDGSASAARFFQPGAIIGDGQGNFYVADSFNHTIRKIDSNGNVTTLAGMAGMSGNVDGQNDQTRFNLPLALCIDPSGNLYIADSSNGKIRKLSVQ